jgi:L-rhamnose mutarotase
MGSSEKFCLKWNYFQTNISASFQEMRKEQDFSDITLTCDGDTRIEAHRVILAGSSNFFSRVLKQQQHPHPLLYMRGMTAGQLSAVVDFIYHGEANIYQEDLDTFLALAEELELKGLNGTETDTKEQNQRQPEVKPVQARRRASNPLPKVVPDIESHSNIWQDMDQIIEPNNVGNTLMVPTDARNLKTQTNYEELDATVESMMEKNYVGKWLCKICGKIDTGNNSKPNMKTHIESNHIDGVSHPCSQCGKSFRSRDSLRLHVGRYRKL